MTRLITGIILLLIGITASAQEFNYWMSQMGAKPSMLGGAVTAADKDNSAIIYNPGTLGFNENSSLSLSSDTYYYSWMNIENGAGKEMDLLSQEFNVFPQILAYNQKIPKLPITITLAAVNKDNSFINAVFRSELQKDLIPQYEGGTVSYYNRIRDNWVGLGYGRKIMENFGVGVSMFISARSMEYRFDETADVYKKPGESDDLKLVAEVKRFEYLDLRNLGMVFQAGISYQKEKFKIGLNVSFPRINMRFLGRSDLKRNYSIIDPSQDSIARKYSVWTQLSKSTYKTPWTIDLGLEFNLTQKTVLYSKVSWFAAVPKYELLKIEDAEGIVSTLVTEVDPEFNNIYMANRSIVNAAIGFHTEVSPSVAILYSLRTDFNYFDRDAFDLQDDFFYGLSYWDIYHFSAGIVWGKDKFDLSLGASYSIGRDRSLPQVVNLSDPVQENFYFGYRDNSAVGRFNQLSIFFGFTYYFPRI